MRVYDMRLDGEGDAGYTFSFQCVECGQKISVSQMSWLANPECQCGKEWILELYAVTNE
jgi:DNA-directed RNA polymerase subunit RPC12/RpoP